jgi:hypothetical protein
MMGGSSNGQYGPPNKSGSSSNGGGSMTGIGGIVQGLGTAYSAYTTTKEAEKARKDAKAKHNADTALQVKQFNINQNRLAGLAAVMSGEESFQRDQAQTAFQAKYGSTDWNQKLQTDQAAGLPIGNISTGEAYQNQMMHQSQQAADARANAVYPGKGNFEKLDSTKYQMS